MIDSQEVCELLRRDILAGVYAPGERLLEVKMTERYNCQRSTLREAIEDLRNDRLVECGDNRAVVVRDMGLDAVIEITETRNALERITARHAARHASDEAKAKCRDIVDRMHQMLEAGQMDGYIDLDMELHQTICEASGHVLARTILESIGHRAMQHNFRLVQRDGRPAQSVLQHQAIVDAICDGDEDRAEDAMRLHLDSALVEFESWRDDQ